MRILWRHILPNAIQPLLAAAALTVSSAILTEAGLSFLGLGDPNTISWGYLLNNAQPFIRRAWWLPVFPGLAIVITILALSLALDDHKR
jgi:peptide/nickel transport system permease protein